MDIELSNDALAAEKEMYDTTHNMWNLINRLSDKELESVDALLKAMAMGDMKTNLTFYQGILTGIRFNRSKICPTCGEAHSPDDMGPFHSSLLKKVAAQLGPEKAAQMAASFKEATTAKDDSAVSVGSYL